MINFKSSDKLISKNCQISFRHLSVLTDKIQKTCQKKLVKAEHLLLLINQCYRLELEDEKLLFLISNNDENQLKNEVLLQMNCHLELNTFLNELSLFWKRYSHVQMDIFIRINEKNSQKKFEKLLKNQLRLFI